jgi:hypothetical protein
MTKNEFRKFLINIRKKGVINEIHIFSFRKPIVACDPCKHIIIDMFLLLS